MIKKSLVTANSQRGAVLVMVVIGLVALIGISGLALDMGHAYVNKTRLQNTLDAAALSGARTLLQTKAIAQAEASARAAFALNVGAGGNDELAAISDADITVQFSETLVPFSPGAVDPDARFIRVGVSNLNLDPWLIQVLGFANKTVGATAVAGPQYDRREDPDNLPEVCDLLPVMLCADVDSEGNTIDPDCNNDTHGLLPPDEYGYQAPDYTTTDGINDCYGYNLGTEVVLKTGSPSRGWDVGPGNYQLIRLDGGQGGDEIRENMAGAYSGCVGGDNGDIETEPGNTTGPVAQGLNTRFGIYLGGMGSYSDVFPPDKVTDAAGVGYPDTHTQYMNDYANSAWDYPDGKEKRREIAAPVGNCTGTTNGQGTVPLAGIACFFLTQPAENHQPQRVYGELIAECEAEFNDDPAPIPPPDEVEGLQYEIVLYKDPDSGDS